MQSGVDNWCARTNKKKCIALNIAQSSCHIGVCIYVNICIYTIHNMVLTYIHIKKCIALNIVQSLCHIGGCIYKYIYINTWIYIRHIIWLCKYEGLELIGYLLWREHCIHYCVFIGLIITISTSLTSGLRPWSATLAPRGYRRCMRVTIHSPTGSKYSKTSLTDNLPRSTTPLYRSLYLGPTRSPMIF